MQDKNNWSQLAGRLLGQIAAVYTAIVFATIILIAPTKALFVFCSFVWNLF